MRFPSTKAFILRTVDYKESDRILTLQTLSHGKISAIARAARKSRKRFGGALEPFAIFECILDSNPRGGQLFVLAEATLINDYAGLAKSLDGMGVAAYILELVRELLPENEPDDRVFVLVEQVFSVLSSSGGGSEKAVAISAGLALLAICGLGISVCRCNACGTAVPRGKRVFFDPRRGGVVCTPCGGGPIPLSANGAMGLIDLEATPIEKVASLTIPPGTMAEIEHAFDSFVEFHLEKKLRTPLFRNQVTT